jgi:hypothetical protein
MEFIYENEKYLSPETCEKLIKMYDKESKKGGKLSFVKQYKIYKDDFMINDPELKKYNPEIIEVLNLCMAELSNYHYYLLSNNIDKYTNNKDESVLYNVFAFDYLLNFEIEKINPQKNFKWCMEHHKNASVCFTIFLNTLEDDAGGKTKFSCGKIIKPVQGKMIVFPAQWTYIHKNLNILKGSKYVLTVYSSSVHEDS